MSDNPRALTVIKDEATGWLAQMNAYRGGRGDDRQFFLSCFTGQSVKVNRKGSQMEYLLSCITLSSICCTTMQPGLLHKFCDNGISWDGLLERFLFAYPDQLPMPYYSEKGISDRSKKNWQKLCDKLTLLEGTAGEHGIVPVACGFTPEGKECWLDGLNNKLIKEVRGEDFPRGLVAYWSKLRIYYGRFALLLALLHDAASESPSHHINVDERTAANVWLLIRYFQSTYRRVYQQLSIDLVVQQAKRISQWLYSKKPIRFKRHELYQGLKHNNLFPKMTSLDAPLHAPL